MKNFTHTELLPMENELKPKRSRSKPNQIVISLGNKSYDVKTSWGANLDVELMGGVMALLAMGGLTDHISKAVQKFGENNGDFETARSIMKAAETSFDLIEATLKGHEEKSKEGRKIRWEHFRFIDEEDYEEESLEDGDETDSIPWNDKEPQSGLVNAEMNYKAFLRATGKKIPRLPDRETWWAHCNFDVSDESFYQEIMEVDGVDIVTIFSRYSFIMTPGVVFKPTAVKMAIEERLCGKKFKK